MIHHWQEYPGYYQEYCSRQSIWGIDLFFHSVCKGFELKDQFQNQIYPCLLSFFPSVGRIVGLKIVTCLWLIKFKKQFQNRIYIRLFIREIIISFFCKQGKFQSVYTENQIKQRSHRVNALIFFYFSRTTRPIRST